MKQNKNESGLVSIVVCMILMIIISLIALSFAAISRREQRQALDSQLSSQAFYAAESGINDGVTALTRTASPITTDITSCDDAQQDLINPNRTLDTTTGVSYTCVFVDMTPKEIVDSVNTTTSSVYSIDAAGLTRLRINWEDNPIRTPQAPFTSVVSPNFTALSGWSPVAGQFRSGLLRIQLIPANFGAGFGRANVAAGLIDYIASPYNASSGGVLNGTCSTSPAGPRQCFVDIPASGKYYLRLRAIYDPVIVTVQAFDVNTPLDFTGAQVRIDSTGKSVDVTRRIVVAKPVLANKLTPDFTLQIGDDLCKRLRSEPTLTDTDFPTIPSCVPNALFPFP